MYTIFLTPGAAEDVDYILSIGRCLCCCKPTAGKPAAYMFIASSCPGLKQRRLFNGFPHHFLNAIFEAGGETYEARDDAGII